MSCNHTPANTTILLQNTAVPVLQDPITIYYNKSSGPQLLLTICNNCMLQLCSSLVSKIVLVSTGVWIQVMLSAGVNLRCHSRMHGVVHSRYDCQLQFALYYLAPCRNPVPYTPLATSGHVSNLWFLSTYHSWFLSSIPSFASVLFSFVSMSSFVKAGILDPDISPLF